MSRFKIIVLFIMSVFMLSACGDDTVSMKVQATAYTSLRYQTSDHPFLAAWGDELKPGMKAIAVSRDLIAKGLTHNTKVKIEGLPGEYLVKDKMNKRWTDKIDIYMGLDTKAAKDWGKKEVTITFKKPEKNSSRQSQIRSLFLQLIYVRMCFRDAGRQIILLADIRRLL